MPWGHAGAPVQAGSAAPPRRLRSSKRRCVQPRTDRCVPLSCSKGACVSFGCLPFGELLQKTWIFGRDSPVDFKASVGPVADPIAIVEIGVSRVPVTYKCFVMAATGAQRARPAGVAIVLGADVAAIQEIGLLVAIDAARYMSQRVNVGIDEPVAGSNVAGWSDTDQSQPRAAWMRFVHALAQFSQRITDVRESVRLSAQR